MTGVAQRLKQLLCDIDDKVVGVVPEVNPRDVFCGHISFVTSNGWRLIVFDDCDEFDYIDHVVAPEGELHHLWAFFDDPDYQAACKLPLADVSRAEKLRVACDKDGMKFARDYQPRDLEWWGWT